MADGNNGGSGTPDWVTFDDEDPPAAAVAARTAAPRGLLPAPPEHDLTCLPFGASTTDSSAYISKMQRRLDLLKQPSDGSFAVASTRVKPRTARVTAVRLHTIGAVNYTDNDDDFNPRKEHGDTALAVTGASGNTRARCRCCCWPWSSSSAATSRRDALSEIDDLLPKAPQASSVADDAEVPLDPCDQPYTQLLNDSEDVDGGGSALSLSDDWVEPEPEPHPDPAHSVPAAIEAR